MFVMVQLIMSKSKEITTFCKWLKLGQARSVIGLFGTSYILMKICFCTIVRFNIIHNGIVSIIAWFFFKKKSKCGSNSSLPVTTSCLNSGTNHWFLRVLGNKMISLSLKSDTILALKFFCKISGFIDNLRGTVPKFISPAKKNNFKFSIQLK